MKFKDGYWEIKNGVRPLNLIGNVDSNAAAGSLSVWTTNRRLSRPGERVVEVPLITTVFSSPLPEVIHVRMYRHKGGLRHGPEFQIPGDKADHVVIDEGAEAWTLRAGLEKNALTVTVEKQAWNTSFTRGGKAITAINGRTSGHFSVEGAGKASETYMAQYLDMSVGETIYGLGERFTPLVKNGQVVDCWNEDGGTASEQAYKNIPFYLSSRGYGVLVNNPGKVSFEIGSEVVRAVQFSVAGEMIDYYIIAGGLKEALSTYTALTGRPALPPAWSFGLWLSTSFTTDYDEKTVNHFVDGMAERKIPLRVFHFDCFWMNGFHWTDFCWDENTFPDPADMIKRVKDKGLKVSVWMNSYVAQRSRLFEEGKQKGYFLKKKDGSVYQTDFWQAGMAVVDFTNPEACKWYTEKLGEIIDMGVDYLKTDFGERIPDDAVYYNGADPVLMHNYYTWIYNKTIFEFLEKKKGKGKACLFARSATAGSQRFPVHWGGDCESSFEAMAETLRGGLSFTLCGFWFLEPRHRRL